MLSPALFSLLPNSVNGATTASSQLPGLKFASFFFLKPKLSFLFCSFSLSCLHFRPQHVALLDSSKNHLKSLSCTWCLLFSNPSLSFFLKHHFIETFILTFKVPIYHPSPRGGGIGKLPLNCLTGPTGISQVIKGNDHLK